MLLEGRSMHGQRVTLSTGVTFDSDKDWLPAASISVITKGERQHAGAGMLHTHTHAYCDTPACFESMKRGYCVLYVLVGGNKGSISADAHTIRTRKDRGERQPNHTHNHTHSCSHETEQKG